MYELPVCHSAVKRNDAVGYDGKNVLLGKLRKPCRQGVAEA